MTAAFSDCDGVVLAVSGGLDSCVLLSAFAETMPCAAVVCHIDHGLRKDSAGDRSFVESLAKKYKLAFESTSIQIRERGSTQNHARCQRRAALRGVANRYGYRCIATAHHHDDWVEGFYINTTRGGGFGSLSQEIRNQHDGIDWIKPLTYQSKRALKRYAIETKISWREDPTNLKTDYTRNEVRAALSATLDAHGDGTYASRLRLENAAKFVNRQVGETLASLIVPTDDPYSVVLSREKFLEIASELQPELIRAAISGLGISTSHVGVSEILEKLNNGERTRLTPKGCAVFLESREVTIMRNFGRGLEWWEDLTRQPRATVAQDTVWFGGRFVWTDAEPRLKPLYKLKTSVPEVEVVGWIPGLDLPTSARKTIKDFPFAKRWQIPVVFVGGAPCWIPGVWKAEPTDGQRWISWGTSTNTTNLRTVRS